MPTLRVGTRASHLARAQTATVVAQLTALLGAGPDAVETVMITTEGDQASSTPLGTGIFVKEIETALLEGRIDIAVHSLKDLPTEPVDGLAIGALPLRGDPRDALVGATLAALGPGATVGTGSPRRSSQLRRLRPDLSVVPVRGNVPTRAEQVRSGRLAAVMLAAAGLARLGLAADDLLSTDAVLPAPGQGALALEIRAGDAAVEALVAALDHQPTRAAVAAERAVLRELGGGCLLPVGAYGRLAEGRLVVDAAVTSPDGSAQARAGATGDPHEPEALGAAVGRQLLDAGALELLAGGAGDAGAGREGPDAREA